MQEKTRCKSKAKVPAVETGLTADVSKLKEGAGYQVRAAAENEYLGGK